MERGIENHELGTGSGQITAELIQAGGETLSVIHKVIS
jgi:hypothetical protein